MHAFLSVLVLAQILTLAIAGTYITAGTLSRSPSPRNEYPPDLEIVYQTEEDFISPVLQYTKTNKSAPGLLFFTPNGFSSVVNSSIIMTDTGDLVWQDRTLNSYTNLRTQSYSNQTYLTFWNSSLGGPSQSHGYGSVDFLDHTLSLAHRVCLADLNIVSPTGHKWPCQVDLHEAQLTNRNTLLVTVYNVTQADLRSVNGTEDGWILDAQFSRLIQAQRRSSSHGSSLTTSITCHSPSPTTLSTFPLIRLAMFKLIRGIHSTSIQSKVWTTVSLFHPATTGRSIRFLTTEASPGNGRHGALGDCHSLCSLPPANNFRWQHHVRLNSTCPDRYLELTMFDNSNSEVDNGTGVSIGKTFQLDMAAMTATLNTNSPVAQLHDTNDEIYSDSQGSHQVLGNGNHLIGYGQVPQIKEFDSDGEVVYNTTFGPANGTVSFRAFKLDNWHAVPSYNPKVLSTYSWDGKNFTVYMSWNGATGIDAWNIFAGPKNNETLKQLATVEKTAFETSLLLFTAPWEMIFCQVEALQEGKVIGRSEMVPVVGFD